VAKLDFQCTITPENEFGLPSRDVRLSVASPVFLDSLFCFAINRAPPLGFPPVVNLLTLGQSEFTLDQVLFQKQTHGNERQTLFLSPACQLVNLLAMQQESPVPKRVMVEIASRRVRTDVAAD
jgi:hypothetical protein